MVFCRVNIVIGILRAEPDGQKGRACRNFCVSEHHGAAHYFPSTPDPVHEPCKRCGIAAYSEFAETDAGQGNTRCIKQQQTQERVGGPDAGATSLWSETGNWRRDDDVTRRPARRHLASARHAGTSQRHHQVARHTSRRARPPAFARCVVQTLVSATRAFGVSARMFVKSPNSDLCVVSYSSCHPRQDVLLSLSGASIFARAVGLAHVCTSWCSCLIGVPFVMVVNVATCVMKQGFVSRRSNFHTS